MTPMLSPLLALQKAIAKAKGAYGAQRVEKAADLVPNLEKMYQMEALERAFGGDNAKALIVMPPERFEDFAKPIFVGDPVHRKMMEDNVKNLQKLRQGFADVPFLEVGHKPGQLPFISGHEGRHRSRALQKRGEELSLVNVFPKYREDFPRRTQEEFIEEMRRQLGESRLVTPEGKLRATPENPEGAIEFPEIFREGGAVHMKDGSTDKVRQLIEEAKGSSGRYDPMRTQKISEYEKGFRDFLAAQQEARESLFKPSPTVGGMAKGAAGALAGYAAQVPGIVGDVLSLYDEFKPERAPNLPEWARALPTTERLQEYYLPENASPELQAGVTGGNLFALGQGLAALPKVVAGGARMAGRGAQALAPTANQMLENYMLKTGQMLPLNVYHGSPHRFAPTPKNPLGEFDPTKIGTGEGAQSYGYGHYLAEAPGVAKTYQPRSPEYEQKLLEKYNRAQAKRDYTTMEILEDAMLHKSPDEIIQRFTNAEDGYTPAHAKAARDFVNWYAKNPPEVGGLYKVDLPDEQIAKMLDWDKPLSEQPESVRNAINSIVEAEELYKGKYAPRFLDKRTTAGEAVNIFGDALGGSDVAANYLREAGIPGIRYLDQGSRGAGEGTRNFVVFPGGESMLNIISREKKGGMVSEDAMRMKMMDKEVQRKAKGGEIKASPTYPGQEFLGQLGRVAERLGITTAEAMKIVSEKGNSPIKAFIGDLIADSMKSAGTALQDWTGTPREITEEQPYSRLISGKGMTTRIDPRALDVAGFASPIVSRLTSAAKGLPQAVKEAAVAAYGPGATASHVVKPKGGNWLTGSVEEALKPLRYGPEPEADYHFVRDPNAPEGRRKVQNPPDPLNQWIEKQLTRYVKNEMGTPEDPVRLVADAFPATKAQMLADKQKQIDKAVADMEKARAVRNFTPEMMTSSQARIRELQKEKELLELRMGLHFGPENVPEIDQIFNAGAASARRMGYFPVEGIAKSDIAKFWEQASDARIKVLDPKKLDSYFGSRLTKNVIEDNPWLERLDPNTPVYNFGGKSTDVGFDHLIDELRNATNPESGLPRNLLINSKDLPKWTVPQAIEHVDKINAWRAVQRQEAAKAVREGIPVHKEYPEGYQWLSVPDLAMDEKALRYATDIGCEGGWCTQGEKTARKYGGGGNRLFVLHDPKGKPVVQIQVEQFGKGPLSGDALNEVEPGLFEKFLAQRDQEGGTHDMHKWLQTTRPDLANRESIGQIKGILNKPPKPEYLPFVQDFVRSGQWSDIGDIQNANMVRIYPDSDLAAKMKAAGKEPPTYVSQDEFTQLLKENPMKRGGAVNDDAIKMAVWNKQIQRKAGGGSVQRMSVGKLVTAGKKAASAAKALTSAGKSADELAEVRKVAPEGQQNVQEILEPKSNVFKPKRVQTVSDAQRMAFPGIYQRPDVIAAEAASRVAPENPALKQLFGVTREDLYQLGKSRQGNLPGELPGQAANPRGSAAAEGVMTRRNRQRILDVNAEAEKYPLLVQGMDPWYVMDPLYKRMVELLGPEQANIEYRKMNTLVGMASPGSEVLVEIPRGTAAYYLQKQGRFPEFIEHIGKPEELRKDVPADIVNVPGHVYHRTAQAIPMSKFIESGVIDMTSPKVPMYIEASQVPEIGFQTRTPVGDAHWSRAVGLADTRGARTSKGKEVIPGGSVSNPEMTQLAPWWRERIAKELGIESVPAQARTWGVFSGQTGVTTPIGAPKLELMAQKIMETANRLGVSPETARDMVILGETYAGKKKGGKVEKKAEGGLTSDDLILEERKL